MAKFFLSLVLLLVLAVGTAVADGPDTPTARLDTAKANLDQIEASLTRSAVSDSELQSLRAAVDPVAAEIATVTADLAPRIEAAKQRLAQLGPKPGSKDPPEPPAASNERALQEKLFADLDATGKRARVLSVQASQISDAIGARRLYWPAWQLARRIRSRAEGASPTRFQKVRAALRVVVVTAAVPIVAVLALGSLVDLFDLPSQFQVIGRALLLGTAVVAISTGLARGLLAPKSPNWRLPPLWDLGAGLLYHATIAITTVFAIEKVMEAVNEVIQVALPTAVATRGLGAAAVAFVLLHQIRKGARVARASRETSRTPQMEHIVALLRLGSWTIVVVLLGAVLIGYIAFAAFLVEQVIAVAATLALLYLLLVATDESLAAAFRPGTALSRALVVTMGLRAETLDQIAILLTGVVRIALYVVAILLVLAPWRIESGDMLGTIQAAFFGFTVGDVTISVSALILAALFFFVVIAMTRALQRWLELKYLPHTKLDPGLQNSIKTSLGYIGFVVALGFGLAHLGLGFDRLSLVAGGLSLGIGLGLQGITNNFVSGLILLWEREIRVGDWITVGDEQGYVRRINVRATEIETFDRALVIMPNSSLMTGVVKNWVRNDRIGRLKLPFTVPLGVDPEMIRSLLIKVAKAHELVVAIPTPQVFFTQLTDAGMKFELVCFVEEVESSLRVTSDLMFEIYARFREAGLAQPPAAPTVTSPALDKLDAWLTAKVAETNNPGA